MEKNKKAQKAVSGLLSRQDYLVVQGNDLAKSFGGLKSFEQRVLDYCFSFVSENDTADKMYEVSVLEIIRHFGLSASGNSYQRVAKALKTLNENTALYLPKTLPSGERGILMTQLFDTLFFGEAGTVQFRFSPNAAPLVFDLKKNFYSFHLQELARIHGKYGLILLKLWESYRHGHEVTTTITGSTEDWQGWFLGKERRVTASRFYSSVLKRATEELEEKLDAECTLMSYKKGRKIVSYELTIVDKSKLVNL
ncbi:replication initiation protein (plasmid) [Lactiplantibacillus plantarum]|uniref:Plasmid replication initiator protein B n=3 Tax=Lactiplantibacillus plantarum TaxID=1590 RepID=A0A345X0D4_LACPN|nr:replication initiation protein [Lactiplantibacillus plantarum]AUT20101.1 RepB family plasmid replication initiator protein [Lactiplantibacillus plantarum]AXJ99936.1 plasmid replication initiator protein B [Lactiplantibacillus plantarum]QQM62745.1 replication initiation protein [Lactiplantibacillus plantarum]